MILSEPFSILTGGPGTGKTTVLREAYRRALAQGETVVLAAPTGKAARRMSEVIGAEASTLHRLLKLRVEGGRGLEDDDPLAQSARGGVDADGFVTAKRIFVDEASMLDVYLAAALFNRVNLDLTKVTLIGDDYQLPSVGPGRVLADLLQSGRVPSTTLVEVHRAAMESWVCTWAPPVRRGSMPELDSKKDFAFWNCAGNEVEDAVVEAVGLLQRAHKVLPMVITPRRGSVFASAEMLNPKLQNLINPRMPENGWPAGSTGLPGFLGAELPGRGMEVGARAGEDRLRIGDYVIQRKNDYTAGVYNGECGTFLGLEEVSIDGNRRKVAYIHFEGHERAVQIPLDDLNVRLAYSITVHSSQGSQWPWLVVVCHSGHGRMLSRQLFYTAITRAQKGLVIVGDKKGLEMSLRNDAPLSRRTALLSFLET